MEAAVWAEVAKAWKGGDRVEAIVRKERCRQTRFVVLAVAAAARAVATIRAGGERVDAAARCR